MSNESQSEVRGTTDRQTVIKRLTDLLSWPNKPTDGRIVRSTDKDNKYKVRRGGWFQYVRVEMDNLIRLGLISKEHRGQIQIFFDKFQKYVDDETRLISQEGRVTDVPLTPDWAVEELEEIVKQILDEIAPGWKKG